MIFDPFRFPRAYFRCNFRKGIPRWDPRSSYLCTERNAAKIRLLVDAILVVVLDGLVRCRRHLDVAI